MMRRLRLLKRMRVHDPLHKRPLIHLIRVIIFVFLALEERVVPHHAPHTTLPAQRPPTADTRGLGAIAPLHPLLRNLQIRQLIAAAVAAEQVLDLVDHGVKDFHFYTMNKADLVYAVCHLLGLRPNVEAGAKAAAA